MKCNKCNQEIPDNSKFCLHCGAKVEVVDGVVCTRCGYKNVYDALFCTECGAKFVFQNQCKQSKTDNIYKMGKFEVIAPFGPSLDVIKFKESLGIINKCGDIVLPCEYHSIESYGSFDYSIVESSNTSKRGFIDKNANTICPCIYSMVKRVSRGGYIVTKDGITGFIAVPNGEFVLPTFYDTIGECGENFIVKKSGKLGLVNRKGEYLIHMVYSKLKVITKTKFEVTDQNGTRIISIC